MDPRKLYKSGIHNADLSYDFSSSATSSLSKFFSYPATKFNIGRSPNSPLSSKPDSEALSTLSNSLEQHSSTEAPSSGKSPSRNSPLQSINSFTPPLDHQDNFQASSRMISEMSALQELESLLMSPDTYEVATINACADSSEPSKSRPRSWTSEPQHDSSLSYVNYGGCKFQKVSHGPSAERQQLVLPRDASRFGIKGLLVECARAIAENRLGDFEILVEQAWGSVSVNGEPLERLGAYMLEGLVARKKASGTAIYRSLRCREPEGSELLTHMHTLYDICPYFKFGYMAANGAIAEAVRNEERVHIIDFQITQGTQWISLIQALAAATGGPPSVRITGVDDPVSRYARGGGLEAVGRKLTAIAEKFNIPFKFHELPVFGPEVTREMLDIRPGEAVAVNFTLQLHHTPDESVEVSNPRDGLLRMVKGLSPKVTTLVEQESNTNTTPFLTRFMETLDYYHAMFESIDVTLPRDDKKRINVEQHCLAKDIVNIIACEGKERLERHELLGKWRSRLSMAGFKPCPLSSYVNSVIRSLLKSYSDNYTLVEKDGAMLLGWKDRNLISASAWH